MRHPQRIPRQIPPLAAAFGVLAFAACVPTGGQEVPDGAASLPCLGTSCIPKDIGAAVTSAPTVDCKAAEQGLEFAPYTVLDSEYPSSSSPSGFASNYFYQYVDGTADIEPQGYTPPAIAQNVCNSDVNNHVLHSSGGPFTGWGGGIGIGLEHLNVDANACPAAGVCPPEGGFTTSAPCLCPNPGTGTEGEVVSALALDVSQWDGISFWARRGPNGQPLMRVLVGDKFTDDDISYKMYQTDATNNPPTNTPRYCERKAECTCLFLDAACDWYSFSDPQYSGEFGTSPAPDVYLPADLQSGGFYCGPPGSHPGSASASFSSTSTGANNYCGRTLCDQPYAAYPNDGQDPQFAGRACAPYTYRNGTIADVCYNAAAWIDATTGKTMPADPLPPEADEQCGDHFTFPVNLSTDWQFYAIPFAQMQQQGWAKQAPYFDLTSASVVRFTWDVGYIDYYIDNVRFYRVARPDGGAPTP